MYNEELKPNKSHQLPANPLINLGKISSIDRQVVVYKQYYKTKSIYNLIIQVIKRPIYTYNTFNNYTTHKHTSYMLY